ncbi:hypothetical protein A3860_19725 [Niastella vici]|uniref:TPM domain-containing protein n=1 Tax=Niastella vici TaxID=1703345 RepID=A0A1V9G0W2_9BACT|nr:TPM domain-containing protein [Niastella vici]OQP64210.1 hypothetical protein A3860_19725 [Niastella vici]
MRTLLILTVFLCSINSFAQRMTAGFIKDRPMPARAVNDFAKWLTKAEKDQLERHIKVYRKMTGFDIVIITLPTLTNAKTGETYTSQEAARQYLDKWSTNDSLKDVRVLLLVDPNEMRIRTADSMGAYLTVSDCQRIFKEKMMPEFEANQYYPMFIHGVIEIENTIGDAVRAKKAAEIAAMNNAQAPQPANSQPANSQSAYSYNQPVEKEMTPGETVVGFLGLGAIIFYFVYRKRRRGVLANAIDEGFASDADAWLTREGTTHRRTVND